MSVIVKSAVTYVADIANNALALATAAGVTAEAAYNLAISANTSSSFAKDRTRGFVWGDGINTIQYDTAPGVTYLIGSRDYPIIANLTQARTWGDASAYSLGNLTSDPGVTYSYITNVYSDVLKIINKNNGYTLTLKLGDNASNEESYIVQPGESIATFYDAANDNWIFTASVL
jgi:hypothetical protein